MRNGGRESRNQFSLLESVFSYDGPPSSTSAKRFPTVVRDGFKRQVPSVLKQRPQGRSFLVEMATNHQPENRSGPAVAMANVTDEGKPYHPQEQAAICEPVIMV